MYLCCFFFFLNILREVGSINMRFFFLKNNRRNFLKTTLNFWFCGKSESFHCIRMGSHPFTLMVSYIKNNNNLDLEKVMINIYKKSLIFKGKIIKMVI